MARSHAEQTTVDAMTRGTGVVGLRIIRDDRVAGDGMATSTVAVHPHHGAVIHRGVVTYEAAMAGRAIIGGGDGGPLFPCGRADQRAGGAVTLRTVVMELVVNA